MAITRINEFQAKPDKAAALCDFLRSIIARIIDAPGCRSCELLVQRDDPTRLAIVEVWDSVDAHQASVSRIPPPCCSKRRPFSPAQHRAPTIIPCRGRPLNSRPLRSTPHHNTRRDSDEALYATELRRE